MRLNSKQILECTGGLFVVEPIDASKLACGITWDSREVEPDDVYLALPGERVDGHRFISDAIKRGAQVILASERPDQEACLLAQEMGVAIIEVSNTQAALADIASYWRSFLKCPLIAVTGSSGKTTTKNLIRDVLGASFEVVATQGNQNNELGVPKTVLSANVETEAVVVEMGMRGLGQITELCEFVKPTMAVITNIGESHIELLKSKENIARAKAEVLTALPDGIGKAFICGVDEFASFLCTEARLAERHIETFWFDKPGEGTCQDKSSFSEEGATARDISLDEQGRPCFTLCIEEQERPCVLPLRGLHNVSNACAAASVGAALGMDIDTVVAALEKAQPECGRQEFHTTRENVLVIDDSYNANPDSMRAALMMFSSYQVPGRRIAVLGDMGELGDHAEACHRGVGQLAATLPLDYLICVGELSRFIAEEAVAAGFDKAQVKQVSSVPEVLYELELCMLPEDGVLVKASRFMGLERVVGGLVN